MVNILGPMFDIKTVGGYRESATDPHGHPAGLAADFLVPMNSAGRVQGDRLAAYAKVHARSSASTTSSGTSESGPSPGLRGMAPMEDRGSDTENHLDHVHINVKPVGASVQPAGLDVAA